MCTYVPNFKLLAQLTRVLDRVGDGGGWVVLLPPPSISKRTPKKPTQIRVKQSLVLFLLICFQTIFMYLLVRYVTNTSLAILLNFKTIFIYIITIFSKASMQLFKRQNSFHLRSLNQCVELLIFEQKINLALILVSEMVLS